MSLLKVIMMQDAQRRNEEARIREEEVKADARRREEEAKPTERLHEPFMDMMVVQNVKTKKKNLFDLSDDEE